MHVQILHRCGNFIHLMGKFYMVETLNIKVASSSSSEHVFGTGVWVVELENEYTLLSPEAYLGEVPRFVIEFSCEKR